LFVDHSVVSAVAMTVLWVVPHCEEGTLLGREGFKQGHCWLGQWSMYVDEKMNGQLGLMRVPSRYDLPQRLIPVFKGTYCHGPWCMSLWKKCNFIWKLAHLGFYLEAP